MPCRRASPWSASSSGCTPTGRPASAGPPRTCIPRAPSATPPPPAAKRARRHWITARTPLLNCLARWTASTSPGWRRGRWDDGFHAGILKEGAMLKRMLGVLVAATAAATMAHAQAPLKLFDAHLHYNAEPTPFYPLDKVLEIFKRNNVAGILATSRPNTGTRALLDAKAPGLWVVPFIRPYRVRSDMQTWFDDPTIYELVQSEYKRGAYRGIGEFHIYGKSAATGWVKKIVDFAVEREDGVRSLLPAAAVIA